MKHSYCDGAIICQCLFHEKVKYNVSNEKISVVFNGSGGIIGYAEADTAEYLNRGFCSWYVNGQFIDVFSKKTVKMLGRKQTVSIETPVVILRSELFLDSSHAGVFAVYQVLERKDDANITVGCTYDNIQKLRLFSNGKTEIESDNGSVYFHLPVGIDKITAYITFEDLSDFDVAKEYTIAQNEYMQELASISVPKGLNEMEKALFYSTYFCALENYKVKGDFRCFMAGHRYLLPMRTYYRDSYYTVLPMYNGRTHMVKEQILTLSKGISPDGNCPSAVKADYSAWWGNHYDSPSFLAMMLYDYIHYTKDTDFLNTLVDGVTIYEKAAAAVNKLSTFADDTCLLYKDGLYNKRDWADEVNRNGYVTYNEILYARALFCLSKMAAILGKDADASMYERWFDKVKEVINRELWDENLGYYINYKSPEHTKRNLSIDTVFACIFGIADDKKAIRMLKNMELLLECKNNPAIKCKDFGVMSVYPFYVGAKAACNKSTQPYNYHNGANWPYLSAMYAYAKRKYGMEYKHALESWFEYNIDKGNYTPIEYFSPLCEDGSLLQAWSSAAAFVLDEKLSLNFWD